jgi:hypothetical protein
MGFNTRKGRLVKKIKNEMSKEYPKVDRIIDIVEEFEKKNLKTIDKLKKEKTISLNRISGGLKQTINAHGYINRNLIGSASKRIYGALLELEKENKLKKNVKSFTLGFILGVTLTLIYYLI